MVSIFGVTNKTLFIRVNFGFGLGLMRVTSYTQVGKMVNNDESHS